MWFYWFTNFIATNMIHPFTTRYSSNVFKYTLLIRTKCTCELSQNFGQRITHSRPHLYYFSSLVLYLVLKWKIYFATRRNRVVQLFIFNSFIYVCTHIHRHEYRSIPYHIQCMYLWMYACTQTVQWADRVVKISKICKQKLTFIYTQYVCYRVCVCKYIS